MADTQDTTAPSTDAGQIPVEVLAQIKAVIPNVSDETIAGAWKQAMANDPSIADKDPQVLAAGIEKAFSAPQQNPAPQQTAPAAPVTPVASPVQMTTPQAAPTNLPVPSADPFKGVNYTQQDLQNQFNPAQVKAAYDTTALRGAYDQQAAQYQQQLPARIAAATFAANGTPGTSAANGKVWDSIDAQNLLQTINKQTALLGVSEAQQKALQEAAVQGLAAGQTVVKTAMDVQDLFGKFGTNVANNLSVQQQQRFNDPSSVETQSAKAAILAQISTLPAEGKAALTKIIGQPNVTAYQLMPLMAQYVPAAFKAFADAANIGKVVAETGAKVQANNLVAADQGTPKPSTSVAPVSVSGGAPAPASNPPATFNFKPGTDMKVMRSIIASKAPEALAEFDRQFPNAASSNIAPAETTPPAPTTVRSPTVPVGPQVAAALNEGRVSPDETDAAKIAEADSKTLSDVQLLQKQALQETDPQKIIALRKNIAQLTGVPYKSPTSLNINGVGEGGVSMGQSGLSSANQAHTSADVAGTQAQLGQFNNGGRQAAQYALVNATQGGPKAGNVATVGSADNQQFNLAVNKLNEDARNLGITAGGDNTSGALLSGAGAAVAAGAPGGIAKAGGVALSALGGLLGSGQALTTRSDPKTIATISIATQEVAAKKAMLLAQEQAYADAHHGDGIGFINSSEYNAIIKSKPVLDPTTGEVKVPVTNDQRLALKRNGFVDASIYLGNN